MDRPDTIIRDKAVAADTISDIVAEYLRPGSNVTDAEALLHIIGALEYCNYSFLGVVMGAETKRAAKPRGDGSCNVIPFPAAKRT